MNIKKTAFALLVAVPLAISTTACIPEACQNLTVSQQDLDAAANGYEVEREDAQGNECELSRDGRSWSVDS